MRIVRSKVWVTRLLGSALVRLPLRSSCHLRLLESQLRCRLGGIDHFGLSGLISSRIQRAPRSMGGSWYVQSRPPLVDQYPETAGSPPSQNLATMDLSKGDMLVWLGLDAS